MRSLLTTALLAMASINTAMADAQLTAAPADLQRLLDSGHCPKCNLAGADLSGMRLMSTDLSSADLRGANLRKTILFRGNLSGADLRGADLEKASLGRIDLSGANLTGLDLSTPEGFEAFQQSDNPDRCAGYVGWMCDRLLPLLAAEATTEASET